MAIAIFQEIEKSARSGVGEDIAVAPTKRGHREGKLGKLGEKDHRLTIEVSINFPLNFPIFPGQVRG